MVKIVAHYLPQFYESPENNGWWVKGGSDWAVVKGARPLFKGHDQPRRPLGGKYYRLDDGEVMRWQVWSALEHGIYGFCFRHYWFNGRPLWEKPAELLLSDRSLKLPFCFAWANGPGTQTGYRRDRAAFLEQQYGQDQERQRHFSYMVPFFEDPRYIKIDKKPVFLILDSSHIPEAGRLLESWNALAVKRGFPGIYFIQMLSHRSLDRRSLPFSAKLYHEPGYTIGHTLHPPGKFRRSLIAAVRRGINCSPLPFHYVKNIIDYDEIYHSLLRRSPGKGVREIPGVFTDWDDSPRRGYDSVVCSGSTPAKFEEYLLQQIKRCFSPFDSGMIFINAWNAWADGATLEPDERVGSGYLEAVSGAKKRSLGLDLPLFYRTLF